VKLEHIDVDELLQALRLERSAWVTAADSEERSLTESERATVCMLAAFERVLAKAARHSLERRD